MVPKPELPRRVGRRAVLAAGVVTVAAAAAGAVDKGLLPGRRLLEHRPANVPAVATGPLVGGSFVSRHRLGTSSNYLVSYPPNSPTDASMPVLIALHGRRANALSVFDGGLYLDHFRPTGSKFAIASVDGGDTYWHARASGEDAAAMLVEEFLPLLHQRGLDVSRIALLGWSMGGYGALRLAGRLGAGRIASVVAESPALWRHAGDSAPGAFDDPADFAANTVLGRQSELAAIAVRIDCGTGDGFCPVAREYAAGLANPPAGGFGPGNHDYNYWRSQAAAQLAFTAQHWA